MSTLISPLSAQDIFSESSTQQLPLGIKGETGDGRVFRYAKVGATALVPGKVYATATEDTNFNNLAVAATAAIGATSVTVTLGGTAATANLFSEGFAVVSSGTGAGYSYKIKSNPAQTSTSGSLVLTLEDKLVVALDTTSKITLKRNPYDGLIIMNATAAGGAIGVAVYPVTAAYYGWVQIEGIAPVLNDSTAFAVGDMVSPSNATDGAAETGVLAQGYIGNALTTGTNAYYEPVLLKV